MMPECAVRSVPHSPSVRACHLSNHRLNYKVLSCGQCLLRVKYLCRIGKNIRSVYFMILSKSASIFLFSMKSHSVRLLIW